jgi:HD-GYP domain-containing protein (c-di-GMP phosphodiesterase class II)
MDVLIYRRKRDCSMPLCKIEDARNRCVGTFVKLEGSWFSHPFPTNTFQIKSSDDLATIQALKNVVILQDPERSAAFDVEDVPDENRWPLDHEESVSKEEDAEAISESELDYPEDDQPLIKAFSLSTILDRRQDYHEFQNHLRKIEGAYQKNLGQGNELFRQLSDRRLSGRKTADAMITSMVMALNNPKTAMSLIDVVGSNGVAWSLSEHALNVCTLSLLIGRQLGLEVERLLELGRGALFHDVGYRA